MSIQAPARPAASRFASQASLHASRPVRAESLPLFPIESGGVATAAPELFAVEGAKVDLLQLALTRLIAQPDCARRMLSLEEAVPRQARPLYRSLMHGLWARRLEATAQADDSAVRKALEGSWTDVATVRRWQAFVQAIGLQACSRLSRRCLADHPRG